MFEHLFARVRGWRAEVVVVPRVEEGRGVMELRVNGRIVTTINLNAKLTSSDREFIARTMQAVTYKYDKLLVSLRRLRRLVHKADASLATMPQAAPSEWQKAVMLSHAWTWECPKCRKLNISHGEELSDDMLKDVIASAAEEGQHLTRYDLHCCPEKVVCSACLEEFPVVDPDEGHDDEDD